MPLWPCGHSVSLCGARPLLADVCLLGYIAAELSGVFLISLLFFLTRPAVVIGYPHGGLCVGSQVTALSHCPIEKAHCSVSPKPVLGHTTGLL